ncbi:MAG: transglycosylase domain-containing protein [Alphaproteobacteria bacterium]|nr:transglycosylase domain-containing protein [Alphaproteobacteria bacterium]MCB9794825.1 transglycosylase domain-containing protein [Alphaproteobacteria bacterium]
MKRALLGLALASLLALGAGVLVERAALAEAEAAGVQWTRLERGLLSRHFYGVQLRGAKAKAVTWRLSRPRVVSVEGLRVDLDALRAEGGAADAPDLPAGGLPAELRLELEGVSLWRGDRVLIDGLWGDYGGGQLSLSGESFELLAPGPLGERAWARGRSAVPIDAVQGELSWSLSWTERVRLEAEGQGLLLSAEALGAERLKLDALRLDLEADLERRSAQGTLTLAELPLELSVDCAEACVLEVRAQDQPFADALSPLSSLIPELDGATLSGRVSGALSLRASGEGLSALELRSLETQGLRVDGAVPRLDALRGGRLSYRVKDADGDDQVRQSGEGSPDWTPLRDISPWLVAAVIAAEDSTFRDHDGYDLSAIQEAWAANREAGSVQRGGSTLTQQLAKNLFLDGSRSLKRKLRELLMAIELDRALGKDRVMELYLNVVEWGPDLWGVRAAADRYFLKRPATLTPNEAAFLAAILPDPKGSYQRWYLRGRAGEVRVDWILQNMADGGAMSDAEAARWSRAPLRFVPPPSN